MRPLARDSRVLLKFAGGEALMDINANNFGRPRI